MPTVLSNHSPIELPNGKSVLVVEDSLIDRAIATYMLTKLGFAVIEAASAEEGMNCLRVASDVALIVVDWNMPEVTGLEFVQQVRKNSAYDHVPILMATCHSSLDRVAQALQAGANEYLMKPYGLDLLRSKLSLLKLGVQP